MVEEFDLTHLPTLHRLCYRHPGTVCDWLTENENTNAVYELARWKSTALHWMAASTDPASPEGMTGLVTLNRDFLGFRDETGALPLHWAARWGSLENLVHLAERNRPDGSASTRDTLGREVVHWYAIAQQNPFAGPQKLEFLTSQMAQRLDARDEPFGGTPLHWAAALGGDVRTLVARMPDLVNERDHKGATPLHWLAATGASLRDNLPILLTAGAQTDVACYDGTIIEQLIKPEHQDIWVEHLSTSRPSTPPM